MFLQLIFLGYILGTFISVSNASISDEFTRDTTKKITKCEGTTHWSIMNNKHEFNKLHKTYETVLCFSETFEVYAFVKTALKIKFLLTISSMDHKTSFNYIYNGSQKESGYVSCKLMLPAECDKIYINLLGYNEDNENVLMDSLEVKIYKIKLGNDEHAVILVVHKLELNNEVRIDIEQGKIAIEELVEIENIKNKEFDNQDTAKIVRDDIDRQGGDNRVLGTWVIILIIVGTVFVISLVATGAYQLGVSHRIAKNHAYVENVEPDRIVSIPRVRGVSDSPVGELM